MPALKEPDLRKVRRKLQDALDLLPSTGGADWHPTWLAARAVRGQVLATLALLRAYLGET